MLRLASALCVALLAAAACGRSHDLGVDPTAGTGAGGATTTSSSGTGGAMTTSSGTGGVPEPTGPTALTVVNGINDYDAVRLCFLPGETPWPAAAGGLPFGTGQAVDLTAALPPGLDVTPWVVAGDLTAITGKTCTQILALAQPVDGGAAPPVVAAPLGVIPKAVLASDKSLLLAPIGCMGGAGHDGPGSSTGCGMGYSSQTPTTGVVFLAMSRITSPTRVSLQMVSASVTFPALDFRVQPSQANAKEAVVAPLLAQGGIGPTPPFEDLALSDFGPLPTVQLRTYGQGNGSPTSTTMLSDVLAGSAVGTAGFKNGAGLVLVAVGGSPGAAAGSFWHKLTYALIKADPG